MLVNWTKQQTKKGRKGRYRKRDKTKKAGREPACSVVHNSQKQTKERVRERESTSPTQSVVTGGEKEKRNGDERWLMNEKSGWVGVLE